MDRNTTRLGSKKVKKRYSFVLEVLMQAQKRIRSRQAILTKHGEAGILLCYCPMPKVLHRYHDKEYSSARKQLVLGVNRVARARY